MVNKFVLECEVCGTTIEDFNKWFGYKQKCPECGSNRSEVVYSNGYESLSKLIASREDPRNLWYYIDYLPLKDRKNIISFYEGMVPVQRWKFLEDFAQEKYHTECRVYVQRYDLNPATGTFKDLAGTVVSSVLKEENQKNYVVASTGNIANAYSRYLAAADISLTAFIPSASSIFMETGIAAYGQKVYRVDGDYEKAKIVAADYAKKNNIILAAGNFDPLRIEAKKTMVYEWLRQLDDFPTVYIQALSGGTGPLGIKKAIRELNQINFDKKLPRQIMIQSAKCDPMARAWNKAKADHFPDGWENDYPVINSPETEIPTLSTGNPKTYPVLSKFIRESGGEILSCCEEKTVTVAKWVAAEVSVLAGPAAIISVLGFLKSLSLNHINNGDTVLINLGEGIRRSADFIEKFHDNSNVISDAEDCNTFTRQIYKDKIRQNIFNLFAGEYEYSNDKR